MPDRLSEQGRNLEGSGANLPLPTGRGRERLWYRLREGLKVASVVIPGLILLSGLWAYGHGIISTSNDLVKLLQAGFIAGVAAGVGALLIPNTPRNSLRS